MTTYQYKIIRLHHAENGTNRCQDDKALNEQGVTGWKLVNVIPGEWWYYFFVKEVKG